MVKKPQFLFSIFLVCAFFFTTSINAQDQDNDLSTTLSNLSSAAGSAYLNPIGSAFGSNLNSGWVTSVPEASIFSFTIELKILGMGSFFSDEQKKFATSGDFRFTSSQVDQILANSGISAGNPAYTTVKNEMLSKDWMVNMSGPTIVGKGDEYFEIDFPGQVIQGETIGQYNLQIGGVSGLLDDMPVFPTGAIQLSLGTVYGTNVAFRWFPTVDIKDLGEFKYFGFGLIHNLGMWFSTPLPIDLALGFFTQTLTVGDIFESKATQFGIYASKTFGIIVSVTPYAGLTIESSTTSIKYDYKIDTPAGSQTLSTNFDLEGDNSVGLTLGAAFHLVFLNLHVDYKLASINTASAGIAFGF